MLRVQQYHRADITTHTVLPAVRSSPATTPIHLYSILRLKLYFLAISVHASHGQAFSLVGVRDTSDHCRSRRCSSTNTRRSAPRSSEVDPILH